MAGTSDSPYLANMRILLMSLGSRGDMEPFLALGAELKAEGHVVGYCMPAQFESLAREVSDQFHPEDPAFLELLDAPEVRQIIGQVGSVWSRLLNVLRLIPKTKSLQQQVIRDQAEAVARFRPDEIVFHIKCIYPALWAIQTGGKARILSPMPCLIHPTGVYPHIAFGKPRGAWWNRFTYTLANWALIRQSILGYGRSFIREQGWSVSHRRLARFFADEVEVEYAFDERLFPRPADWPAQAAITRFRERDKLQGKGLKPEVEAFLEHHDQILYVGFGSMVNAHPQRVATDIIEVAQAAGLAVLLNRSWGGIEPPASLPSNVLAVDDVPFDGLFPRIQGAIHHGGSGTTHSALRCGLPQAIIPHIADQFFWSRQVVSAGFGVEGFPINAWSKARFARVVDALLPHMQSVHP